MDRRTRRDDERFMSRALALAACGAGETNPNPLVGCVIVKGGRVLAEAHHARAGGPHAEAIALERAGRRALGATLYVNLEPCTHQGRTPPCAPRVAAAGLRRVVIAMRDPNPLVDGRGIRLLRRRGIDVTLGVREREARRQNERFLVPFETGRPFVLLKAAMTLDGRIATASGDSKWITSAAQRREARGLRRLFDAVLVGIGTALADDPLLLPTPRVHRTFTRVVLDSRLRLPLSSRLVRSARRAAVVVVGLNGRPARRKALEAAGVTVLVEPRSRGRVRLPWALEALQRRGVKSVMVEGGAEVLGSFLRERLFDQVILFRAPVLLGGRRSLGAFGGLDPRLVREAVRLAGPDANEPSAEVWYPAPKRCAPRRRLS